MFRQLSVQEKSKFKQWARDNYIPPTEINPVWHPVVQAECRRMCEEIKSQLNEHSDVNNERKSLETK